MENGRLQRRRRDASLLSDKQNALPPRNGHAKGGISDGLIRKIKHEFEHIALYESISDHFEEVREELNQA